MGLYHPNKINREPLVDDEGRLIEASGPNARKAIVELVRNEAKKLGHSLTSVPVVNRRNGDARFWNISKGEEGSATYAEILCSDPADWRLGTVEEGDALLARIHAERKAIAQKKLNFEQYAIHTLANKQEFQNLIDAATTEQPAPIQPKKKDK